MAKVLREMFGLDEAGTSHPLTVKSLTMLLQKMPPNAVVYEERGGELRAVTDQDVRSEGVDSDFQGDMDADNRPIKYPIVVLKAWG